MPTKENERYINRKGKRRFKTFLFRICAITLFMLFILLAIDFIRFPECYLPTWKYHLECDIKAGDEEAIKYYEEIYIANGRELFE